MDWSNLKLIGFAILAVMLGLSLYRRREALLLSARRLSFAIIVFWFASNGKWWQENTFLSMLIGFAVATIADTLFFAPRSRNIQQDARDEIIRKFEARSGQKYDPSLHDVDHVVPFARGGVNSMDNLRVTERRTNRSKRAKTPWWDVLGHLQGESESLLEVCRAKLSTGHERLVARNPTGQNSEPPRQEKITEAGCNANHGWTEDDQRRLGLK